MFGLKRSQFRPAYLQLYKSGELQRRVKEALRALEDCTLCPRDCHRHQQDDKGEHQHIPTNFN